MAGKTVQNKVIVSAKDQVSPELKKIRQNFRSFAKQVKGLGSNLKNLGAISFAPMAGGLAMAGGIVKNAVSSMVSYGGSVDDASRNLQIASDALQAFRYEAEQSGSSASEMDGAIMMMNKNIANAANGTNKNLVGVMKHLNISMTDTNGKMKTAAELMPEVADAIKRQTNATQKAYIATQFFGKSGQGLLKTLAEGSEGLNQQRKEAEHFGAIMGKDAVAAATLFGDSMTRTRYAVQGVQNAIGEKMLPILQPMLDDMNEWIATNREWLATTIGDAVKDLAVQLKEIDFKTVISSTISFIKNCIELFNYLGGIKTVCIAVSAVFAGKFIVSLVSTCSALVSVAKTTSVLTKSMAAMAVVSKGAFLSGITSIISTVGTLTKTFIAFNAALWANPITWIVVGIIAAVGLLAFAVYEIYKHWDGISEYFSKLWESIKVTFAPLGDFFKSVLDGIKSIFVWYVGYLQNSWNVICNLPTLIKSSFDNLGEWFGNLWGEIKNLFFAPFERASNKVGGWIDSAKGWFDSDKEQTSSLFEGGGPAPMIGGVAQTASILSSSNKSEVVVSLKTDNNTTAAVESTKTTGNDLKVNTDTGASA